MLITITAIASYINYRYIRLPKSIGLTLFSLLLSLVVMTIISVGGEWLMPIRNLLGGVNFNATVMNGLLSFLLFAGALHINSIELSKHKVTVSVLATVSVFLSCAGVGFALWWIASHFFGLHIDLIYYLLFGALISPTDPIAVLNAMKGTNTPEKVRIKITGESLFNDAVGIVMFVVMLEFIGGKHQDLSLPSTVLLLAQQGLGGLLFGYLLGVFASYFLRRANNDEVAILMTLSLVTAGYSLATLIQVSGPVSMVVAGLVVGNQCRKPTFSQHTVQRLDLFWSLLDDVLNSFLFILIGLETLFTYPSGFSAIRSASFCHYCHCPGD
jgi:CPA1 family monovalent cation:H+ antiporter